VLKWARTNGCPWDEESYLAAAIIRDSAVMQCVHDEGCPVPEVEYFDDDY